MADSLQPVEQRGEKVCRGGVQGRFVRDGNRATALEEVRRKGIDRNTGQFGIRVDGANRERLITSNESDQRFQCGTLDQIEGPGTKGLLPARAGIRRMRDFQRGQSAADNLHAGP